MEALVGILGACLIASFIALFIQWKSKDSNQITEETLWKLLNDAQRPPPNVVVNLEPVLQQLDKLPHKVLQSVQSSSNTYKGALGELIGYMKLHAEYDRIVPLNNIVDFMCVKLPTDTDEGHIDFIDVKTGDKSRLSKDQKALQKLIQEKRVNFVKIKVQTTTGVPKVESKS